MTGVLGDGGGCVGSGTAWFLSCGCGAPVCTDSAEPAEAAGAGGAGCADWERAGEHQTNTARQANPNTLDRSRADLTAKQNIWPPLQTSRTNNPGPACVTQLISVPTSVARAPTTVVRPAQRLQLTAAPEPFHRACKHDNPQRQPTADPARATSHSGSSPRLRPCLGAQRHGRQQRVEASVLVQRRSLRVQHMDQLTARLDVHVAVETSDDLAELDCRRQCVAATDTVRRGLTQGGLTIATAGARADVHITHGRPDRLSRLRGTKSGVAASKDDCWSAFVDAKRRAARRICAGRRGTIPSAGRGDRPIIEHVSVVVETGDVCAGPSARSRNR
jgi:hypothetical protein